VKHRILFLALFISICTLASSRGQESEFYKKPTTPKEFWRAMQFEMSVGKFDLAAGHLKGLLESKPTDQQWLEIESKDGLVTFLRLRNVPRWSGDKQTDTEAKQNVEQLIAAITEALRKELTDPVRIARLAKNLTATPEEAAFAQKELMRSGVAAIPVLLDLLRGGQPQDVRSAILELLPQFEINVVPPLIAALDVNDANLRMELLDSLRKRRDYLSLPFRVETDLTPTLWYFSAALPVNPESMRKKASEMLLGLLDRDPEADRFPERRTSQWRLTQFARKFLEHKERFSTPDKVNVWKWDGAKPVLTEMATTDAEEYYGLRYARWALQVQPDYTEAQRAFITLALDKHFARSAADARLAQSSPELYSILVTAPYSLVSDLLEEALREKRIRMAVALLQVLGDRNEVKAARPSEIKGGSGEKPEARPALLIKAMDYPDRRVQFAAVDALLRTPGPQARERGTQIVRILAGYLQADPAESGSKPKAMIGDFDRDRGEALARVVRQAGLDALVARTGKDVLRRLQEKADIDLIIIDQHLPGPMLPDFLAQARADFRLRGIPLLVVASPDQQSTAHPITLLARLAALVAAEEHIEMLKTERILEDPLRGGPAARFKIRADKLRALVESAGIRFTEDVRDRLEYLIYLTTPPAEMGLPVEMERSRLTLSPVERTNRMNALRSDPNRGHISPTESPFSNMRELTPKLAEVAARYEGSLTQEVIDAGNIYWKIVQEGQIDPASGRILQDPLPAVSIRYPVIEAKLNFLVKGYPKVRVIPEVFSTYAFKEEVRGFVFFDDPKMLEAEKRNNAKIAIEWLRKMAIGELPDFPVSIAETALRQALQSPDHAPLAIDAVARLPGREAQQDLASTVLGGLDPAIRAHAADALIKHIQLRGSLISDPQRVLLLQKVSAETDATLKNRLLALQGILKADAKQTGARLLGFTPAPAAPPKEEPKEEPKKEN
jgi:CheY-like chemotaxis protein